MNKKICIGMLFAAMTLAACGGSGATDPDDVSSSNSTANGTDLAAEEDCSVVTDACEGQKYKTTTIGDQVWMAQNLNIATEESWCYDDDPANCETYGRLYTWYAAQTVCPAGWHLPSKGEFETLLESVGSSAEERLDNLRDSSWSFHQDKYGFSALPAGYYFTYYKEFHDLGNSAYFWSSKMDNEGNVYALGVNNLISYVRIFARTNGCSVRCIKDN